MRTSLELSLQQVNRVVDHIEAELGQSLQAEDLAAFAQLSVWQLHRLFRAVVGESLMDYVRRRRLAQASEQLRYSQQTVLDIALACGFDSHEVFTRAFRREFHCSPTQYRRAEQLPASFPRPRLTPEYLLHRFEGITLTPEWQTLPERHVAGLGLQLYGHESAQLIPDLWRKLRTHPQVQQSAAWGVLDISPDQRQLRYLAAIAWPEGSPVPEGWQARRIPAGRYARFQHQGSVASIQHSVNYLHAVWLPQSGQQLAARPELEYYPSDQIIQLQQLRMDMLLPVDL
ncbi:GyrI-like domain-containing protein [Leeia sp.]|uniref:AraC family transcriptional regulator n=1 Tax=Leeia sp. TaxID=2884678 RepID=UPI0035B0350B